MDVAACCKICVLVSLVVSTAKSVSKIWLLDDSVFVTIEVLLSTTADNLLEIAPKSALCWSILAIAASKTAIASVACSWVATLKLDTALSLAVPPPVV